MNARSWRLLPARLLFWGTGATLSALTPVYNSDAPVWVWPFALIACLLKVGETVGAMRRERGKRAT